MSNNQQFLEVALSAADAADKVVQHYWQSNVEVELKEDKTPVTVADVETEKAIKAVIMDAFPEHGFYGEETGKNDSDSEYLWLIDPIDGTKSFVRGYPMFSTQIALMHKPLAAKPEMLVGVSSAVIYGERLWAAQGEGAFMNGKAIQVSDLAELDLATLSLGNLASAANNPSLWGKIGDLVSKVNRNRGYGDFLHYHYLASGRLEIIVESDLNILDIAALTCIIREAGGTVTALDGSAVTLDIRNLLATNGPMRKATEALLHG